MPTKVAKPATSAKNLIYNPRTWDLKEFEELAAAAKDSGFTHIEVSGLAERTDWRGEDKDSPWCEWCVSAAAIFKHVTPPGLEDAYPADFVKRQMDFMKAKHKIVQKLGMRAAYWGIEPHWLSERVYRKHPEWRGSRADNSLRTTGMYFAPNTDHPEVRELYRLGVRELLKQCPLIDTFTFHANDAGSFYPWAKRLYVNPNGPTGGLGKDMGDRVVDFLLSLRQGALEAGVDAWFFTDCHYWFIDDEAYLFKKSLKPGVGIHGRAPGALVEEHSFSYTGEWNGGYFTEVVVLGFPTPMQLIDSVAEIKTSPVKRFYSGSLTKDYFDAFNIAMTMPPATNERTKMDVLRKIAGEMYAEDVVDEIVDGWYTLDNAQSMMNVAGIRPFTGNVMLRWFVRPLVAHQEMLTEEERSYWEPYIYQSKASQPDTYLDYINHSGYRVVSNWEEASRPCCAIDYIEGTLADAANKLQKAADKTAHKKGREKLIADVYRVRAMRCAVLTIRHYLHMGTLIYVRDAYLKELAKRGETMTSTDHRDPPALPKGDPGSHGLFYMHRAMRWELDNTNELIKLIKESPVPLIYSCPNPKVVGCLVMGGDILEQLQKKVDIMLKYWRTAEIGWYRPTFGG